MRRLRSLILVAGLAFAARAVALAQGPSGAGTPCSYLTPVSLLNAGFEEGTTLPMGWVAGKAPGFTFARVTDYAHDGTASAYIRAPENGPMSFAAFNQTVAVPNPNRGLQVGAWVRTRGVTGGSRAYLGIGFLDANSQWIDTRYADVRDHLTGDSDWTYLTVRVGTIPSQVRFIQVDLFLNGRGEAWFDNVSLVQLTPRPEPPPTAVTLLNAGFEEGTTLPTGWVPGNQNDGFTFARVTDRAHDGVASAYIRVPENGLITYPFFAQTVALANPNSSLQLGGWVRTRSVTGGYGASLVLNFLDGNSDWVDARYSNEKLTGDSDWTYLTVQAADIPSRTRFIQVSLILNGRGEAWFDSVSLIEQLISSPEQPPTDVRLTLTDQVLQQPFYGFGVENNPFLYMPENPTVTEADLALVEGRIRVLQPRLVRVFFLTTWWDTTFATPRIRSLLRLLQFYQSIGSDINLCLVDWDRIWNVDTFPLLVPKVRGLLDYLVRQQGLSRVRYLTLYNEPDLEPDLPDAEAYVGLYQMMHDALQAANLPIDLVGADVAVSDLFFDAVVPRLAPLAGVFSYHDYPEHQSRFDFELLARDRLANVATAGGGKPLFLWEFNVLLDGFDPAIDLAQFALSAMNQGLAGISYWEVYDMLYPGGRNAFGLWAYKDEGWRLRPTYYIYGLLTRLTQSGAAVVRLEPASCDQTLPAATVRNPDGTRTVYVVNPGQTAVSLRLTGLPSAWRPRRYLITETMATRLIQASALFADETSIPIQSGELQDQLPPRSIVAYTDAP